MLIRQCLLISSDNTLRSSHGFLMIFTRGPVPPIFDEVRYLHIGQVVAIIFNEEARFPTGTTQADLATQARA
jgi:hypothetical protein